MLWSSTRIIQHVPPPEPAPWISLRAAGYFWPTACELLHVLREGWGGQKSVPLSLPIYIKHHKQNAPTGGIISYFISTSQIRTECKSSKIPYSFSEPFFIHLLHFGFPTPGTVALAPGRETASIHHQQKHSPAKRSRNWIIYSISLQTQSKFPQHLSMAAQRRKPLKARNFLSCHQTSYCFQGLNIQKNTSSSAHPSKEIPWCVCVLFYCQEAGGKFNKLWWRLV